jgi:hypothetical protein
VAEREVIPLPNNINKLDWQTLSIGAIDAKRVSSGVANHSLPSDADTPPKAKVTRSNRVGCASFPDIAVYLSAECPRNRFASRSPILARAAW